MKRKLDSKLKKYIFSSVLASGLEWYDFCIFGYLSPIFSQHFFSSESALSSMIQTFFVFAIGFLSRPIGAYIFGKIGDQKGRKKALLYSMFLMALSTFLLGIMPTYHQVGALAPVLLICFRIMQGVSLGGEFTGALSFLLEHSPKNRRGFVVAWIHSGGFLGGTLGAIVAAITSYSLSTADLYSYGWRIPFLIGVVIAGLAYYLRTTLQETPMYKELVKYDKVEQAPFKKAIKERYSDLILVICMFLPCVVWVYFLFVFLPMYLTALKHWDYKVSLVVNILPSLFVFFFVPLGGFLSDIWGRKRVIMFGYIVLTAFAPVALYIFSNGSPFNVACMQLFAAVPFIFAYGPVPALIGEVFPTSIRNTCVSVSYHVSTGVFGGLTPMIMSWLTFSSGSSWYGPLLWLVFSGFIGMFALYRLDAKPKMVLATS
jgi:MHS family proline/betaine transporter-like MFS transporter